MFEFKEITLVGLSLIYDPFGIFNSYEKYPQFKKLFN